MVSVRHARFNAGLLVSTYYNAHRSQDADPMEVWDFIPGYERDEEEVERDRKRRSIKSGVEAAFTRMQGKTLVQVRAEATAMIRRLKDGGTEDAELMVKEAFEQVIRQPLDLEVSNG